MVKLSSYIFVSFHINAILRSIQFCGKLHFNFFSSTFLIAVADNESFTDQRQGIFVFVLCLR